MEKESLKKFKIFGIIISILLGCNLITTGVLLSNQIITNNVSKEEITRYTLYIGTNDKDTYTQLIPFDTCVNKVRDICLKYTGGCTLYIGNGYWLDDNNKPTKEETIICVLEDISLENVHKICDEVIKELNQNSILIESDNVKNTYYSLSN